MENNFHKLFYFLLQIRTFYFGMKYTLHNSIEGLLVTDMTFMNESSFSVNLFYFYIKHFNILQILYM